MEASYARHAGSCEVLVSYGPSVLQPLLQRGLDAENTRPYFVAMREFCARMDAHEVQRWSAVAFGARAVGQASSDPGDFLALLDALAELLMAAKAQSVDPVGLCQHGIAALGRPGWSPILRQSIAAAHRMLERSQDPKEAMRWGFAALGELYENDLAAFERGLAGLERFSAALSDIEVSPAYPIFYGVAQVARALPLDELVRTLPKLAKLAGDLVSADLSPYPAFEHGLGYAFELGAYDVWLLQPTLTLACTMAAVGQDPTGALRAAVASHLPSEPGGIAMRLATGIAKQGVDPGRFLEHSARGFWAVSGSTKSFVKLCETLGDLMTALQRRKLQPMLTFQYGLPNLFHPGLTLGLTTHALELSIEMARQGIDPGPVLEHGVAATFQRLSAHPERCEQALRAAQRVLARGLSPWRLLEHGAPAAHQVCAGDAEFESMLQTLTQLCLDFQDAGQSFDQALSYTVAPIAQRGDPLLLEETINCIKAHITRNTWNADIEAQLGRLGAFPPSKLKEAIEQVRAMYTAP